MSRILFYRLACVLWAVALVGCGGHSSGSIPLTSAQAVAAAKSALVIGYATGDSALSVSQNLSLPLTGSNGSTITWVSSNSAAVTTAGVVSQPATGDVAVTLSATITVGAASDIKVFPLTVKWRMTDAQAVAAAKTALAIGYATGDADTSVTQNLTLPLTGSNNCVVSWSSSTNPIVSAAGSISRPVTGDVPVTLTATITSHSVSGTKAFIVMVKARMTDAQAVAAAKAALVIGYASGDSASSVTQKLTLPLTGSSGCTISWASSDGAVDATAGTIQRPVNGDTQPTLTATISSHGVSDTAAFTLTVKGQMSDADAVAAAMADLNITYASGDSAAGVTQNVTLLTSGSDGCTVTWASGDTSVVSTAGVVTQPTSGDAPVVLTATISSHGVNGTKEFPLTVKMPLDDAAAVAADKTAVTIGYGPGDSDTSVTKNVFLQTSGTYGSTITWTSDYPAIISISGGVAAPADDDASVNLTATIKRGTASDTAWFQLTVKALVSGGWINSATMSPKDAAVEVDPVTVIRNI